jgi:hypothetical protein
MTTVRLGYNTNVEFANMKQCELPIPLSPTPIYFLTDPLRQEFFVRFKGPAESMFTEAQRPTNN